MFPIFLSNVLPNGELGEGDLDQQVIEDSRPWDVNYGKRSWVASLLVSVEDAENRTGLDPRRGGDERLCSQKTCSPTNTHELLKSSIDNYHKYIAQRKICKTIPCVVFVQILF